MTVALTQSGGAAVQAGTVLSLQQPAGDGLPFRARLRLDLPLLPGTMALALHTGSRLKLRFADTQFDISPASAAWVEHWPPAAARSAIRLRRPAPVVAAHHPGYARARLYRAEGAVVSEAASHDIATGAVLAEPFLAAELVVDLYAPRAWTSAAMAHDAQTQDMAVTEGTSPGAVAAANATGATLPPHAQATGGGVTMSPLRLGLRGRPTAPRLRLWMHDAAGDEQTLWQWIEPGEHATCRFDPGAGALAGAWAPALERALGLHLGLHPDPAPPLRLWLDVESDAPARVEVEDLLIEPLLTRELLASPPAPATAPLLLAGHAGTLSVQVSARLGPAQDGAPGGPPAAALAGASPPPAHLGLHLGADESVLVAWPLAAAQRLHGLQLYLHDPGADAPVTLSLLPDAGDVPGTRALAEAVATPAPARLGWQSFRWPALDLQAGRYWLRLGPAQGPLLWLAAPDADGVQVFGPGSAPDATRQSAARLPLRPLFEALDEAAAASAAAGAAGGPSPPVAAQLGAASLDITMHSAASFTARLEPLPPGLLALDQWALRFTALEGRAVTVESIRQQVGITD